MSGLCGFAGPGEPAVLESLLAAIGYRGTRTEVASGPGWGLGYRHFPGRPGKSPGIFREGGVSAVCAGTLAPTAEDPAAALARRLVLSPSSLDDLDGAFAFACYDEGSRRLTLARDPFGVRSLYLVEHAGALWFASELKQLLAIPGLPVEPDPVAIHKYLTFSFVPGEDLPVRGVRRALSGRVTTWDGTRLASAPYLRIRETAEASLHERKEAVRLVRRSVREAVTRRLAGEREVGLFLSGGLDSSAIALFLKEAGVSVRAFSLDFGEKSVERDKAETVARHLSIPLETVPATGEALLASAQDVFWKLDLPFGDPVTGPQYLLGRAAREAGLTVAFNGEGGDQLFGGWSNKPMIAAELFAGVVDGTRDSREERYLESFHRFYGLEDRLYSEPFAAAVGPAGQRRAHLAPYLRSEDVGSFLGRLRLADLWLKGSQNILARAERMGNGHGLDVRMPLFDRALAEAAFRLPPQMKLKGANEKFVVKRLLNGKLPEEIVFRRKSGMGVPITDLALGPLRPLLEDLLSPESVTRRGFFQPAYVAQLLAGRNEPHEARRRRVGERLWTLAALEAWLRLFVDGRGKRP